jgi:hypothetical protein
METQLPTWLMELAVPFYCLAWAATLEICATPRRAACAPPSGRLAISYIGCESIDE